MGETQEAIKPEPVPPGREQEKEMKKKGFMVKD